MAHLLVPDDPALPPVYGDGGWSHTKAYVTLDSVSGGGRLSCDGWFHLKRVPTDDSFPFAYEGGSTKWKCDDGRRVDANVDGRFEIDPATQTPVFVLYVTGIAR